VVVFLGGCEATVNTPPTITASAALTRRQGSTGDVSTIAMVDDAETPRHNLAVTATSLPNGPFVSNITNINGTITANVAASCSASLGANMVILNVTDANNVVTSTNLTVNVTANTPPVLGEYAATSLDIGKGANVSPSAQPADNGSVLSLTAAASS